MKKIPVIVDVDTGIDDAMALVIACASECLDIRGVTTVAGNVELEHTTRNTLNILDLLGRKEIKVAEGADKPLERELFRASLVHGKNGLRGYDFAQNVDYALQEEPAWDFMYEIITNSDEKITIVCLGPVTNVAILLERYPQVKEKIEKIVFMGTSYHDGNPSPVATFNVLVDPEAFRQVIHSGIDFYACPLDTTRQSYITTAEIEEIRDELEGPAADLVKGILANYGSKAGNKDDYVPGGNEEQPPSESRMKRMEGKSALHDPATVAFLIAPELFTFKKYYCDVECKGELTTGMTLIDKVDYYGKTEEERNLFFIDSVNREKFIELFMDSIRYFS